MNTEILQSFNSVNFAIMPVDKMPLITVCFNPTDYPNKYTARLFLIGNGNTYATSALMVEDTLEDIRKGIPPFFTRVDRDSKDDPVIVEVWI